MLDLLDHLLGSGGVPTIELPDAPPVDAELSASAEADVLPVAVGGAVPPAATDESPGCAALVLGGMLLAAICLLRYTVWRWLFAG